MREMMNPLIPAPYDIAASALAVATLVFTVVAIISIVRASLRPGPTIIWILIVIFAPVLGSLAWFLSKPATRAHRASGHA